MTETHTIHTLRDETHQSANLDQRIGQRVRHARRDRTLSIFELADKLNISAARLQKIELGQSWLSASLLVRVGQVLGRPTKYFFDDRQCPSSDVEPRQGALAIKQLISEQLEKIDSITDLKAICALTSLYARTETDI